MGKTFSMLPLSRNSLVLLAAVASLFAKANLLDGLFSSVVSRPVRDQLRHRPAVLVLTRVRLEGPSTCFIVDHKGLPIVPCICDAPSAPSRRACSSFHICDMCEFKAWSFEP
jgi:hypothetical protein